jgi:predicted enzyme related to lactoylglutathione lyase
MTNSNRVIHFEVQADDVERAITFYKEVFGWKIEMIMKEGEDGGMMDYWGITTGKDSEPGINGGMYTRTDAKKLYNYDCIVSVQDIDKAIKAVKANGGKVIMEKNNMPNVGWFASAADTEGNVINLMQSTMTPMKK